MIRPLRERHRIAWRLMAVGLPLALAFALRARAPVPANAELPAVGVAASDDLDEPMQLTFQRDDLWGALGVRTSVLTGSTRHFLELEPLRDLRWPDVLVYWLPDASSVADLGAQEPAQPLAGAAATCDPSARGVPTSARLLGGLRGREPRRFALPPDSDLGLGAVLLYSLGHQEWLGTARMALAEAGG